MKPSPCLDREPKSDSKQTFIGVWLRDDNLTADEQNQMEICLNQIFYYYQTFDSIEQFTTYFGRERHVARMFLIISVASLSLYSLVNLSGENVHVEKVYVFSSAWTFTPACFETNDIHYLFQTLQNDIRKFLKRTDGSQSTLAENDDARQPFYVSRTNLISTSIDKFIATSDHSPPNARSPDDAIQFFKFLTMIKILLCLPYDVDDLEDMWQVCREAYDGNAVELQKIADLSVRYEPERAIEYYTRSSSVFRIVNQACRTEDVKRMYEFRAYINDLHKELDRRSQLQDAQGLKSCIGKVYRGQVLPACVLQKLIDSENKLISMNGFLSTTLSTDISDVYSDVEARSAEGASSVRFALTIDRIEQPFAHISEISEVKDENEVLFSVGSIWSITAIKFHEKLYEIELSSSDDLDSQLETLIANYRQHDCNLVTVGDILRDLGNYDEAKWFYEKMLQQNHLSVQTRAELYYRIGMMERKLEHNDLAFTAFKKAAKLLEPSISKLHQRNSPREIYKNDSDSTIVAAYNNMGLIHEKKYAFDEARNCYMHALEVPNGSRAEQAIVNNNLGLLYARYQSNEQARKHFSLAVELMQSDLSYWAEFKANLGYIEGVLGT